MSLRSRRRASRSKSKKSLQRVRRLLNEPLERRILLTTVTAVDPLSGSHTASTSTNVSATFSAEIAAATDETFVLQSSQRGLLSGSRTTVSTSGNVATHDPAASFYRISRSPTEAAESFSQLFLGVRIQCAKCHNHPYESISQRDYYGLAAYFAL